MRYTQCLSPREVSLAGVEGVWEVSPPTALTAITLLEAQEAFEELFAAEHASALALGLKDEEAAQEAAEEAAQKLDFSGAKRRAKTWLGEELHAKVFSSFSPEGDSPRELKAIEVPEQIRALATLAGAFTPPEPEEEEEEDAGEEDEDSDEDSSSNFEEMTCRLAFGFKKTPGEILEMKWPHYLSAASHLPKAYAREQIRNAGWYAGAKTENGLDDIIDRAYPDYEREAQATPPWEAEGISKQAWKEKKKKEAARMRKEWLAKQEELQKQQQDDK